jgi:hypothetical protein
MTVSCSSARLTDIGVLAVYGADARAFLHAQLTNDIEHLPHGEARRAGWCSAKGRLLATLMVVPHEDGFLLLLARDLASTVAKRLQMFVLRSKVKITDEGADWAQFGIWGAVAERTLGALALDVPAADLGIARATESIAVRVAADRYLVLARGAQSAVIAAALPGDDAEGWALEELRAGRAQVLQATQDLFVPQMVNLERLGGVDFRKGCYPGQEIVARTQYRGQLKRRMVRLRAPQPLRPGQDLYSDDLPGQASGTVVNAVAGEALAVLQISTLEARAAVRAEAGGAALEVLPLPGAA